MKFALLLGLALAVQGCGPSGKKNKVGPDVSQPQPSADADEAPHDAGTQPSQLDDAECEALLAHLVQVEFESQRKERPAEQQPTEDDLRRAKDALRVEFFAACVGATRKSFHYDCAMTASTPAEIQSCMGGE